MYNQYNSQNQNNPYIYNLNVIKDFFKRPIVLFYAGLSVAIAVASLVFNIYCSSSAFLEPLGNAMINIFSYIYGDLSALDVETFSSTMSSPSSVVQNMISSLTGMVLTIIMIVSIFIIYFKSKNESTDSTPSAGFTINYVISIISLVSAIFLSLILLFVGGFAALIITAGASDIAADIYISSDYLLVICWATYAVLLLACAYLLFAAINQVRFFSSLKKSLNTPELRREGAAPLGVAKIIDAAVSVISAVICLLPVFMIDYTTEIGNLLIPIKNVINIMCVSSAGLGLLTAVQSVIFALIAFGYNKHIKETPPNTNAFVTNFNQPMGNAVSFEKQNLPKITPHDSDNDNSEKYSWQSAFDNPIKNTQQPADKAIEKEPEFTVEKQEFAGFTETDSVEKPEFVSFADMDSAENNSILEEVHKNTLEEIAPETEEKQEVVAEAEVDNKPRCRACNEELPENSIFCLKCGTKV